MTSELMFYILCYLLFFFWCGYCGWRCNKWFGSYGIYIVSAGNGLLGWWLPTIIPFLWSH